MVRILITIAAVCVTLNSNAQQRMGQAECPAFIGVKRPLGYRQSGLLEASATFTPSTMLARESNNFYLTGFAEYHFDRRVSLRSDSYFHLNGLEADPFVNTGFRSYLGVLYHLIQSPYTNFDATIGFQPGVAIMSKNNYPADGVQPLVAYEPSRNVLSPSFNISIGVKYYVWKYFNFFANVNYFKSKMGGIPEGPVNTDEIAFSAGLGFQIGTKRLRPIVQ